MERVLERWLPKLPEKWSLSVVKIEVLAGLTVALALVPEAVAFSFVAGVQPLVGLYAAFLVGLITACIGGRPGMISGATGALAVVMVSLVAQHGVEYLFATVLLMGLLQILAGILHLGRFIRIVPHPVMLGFVNGLAIVIFLAQMGQFKVNGVWMNGQSLYLMLGLVAATMAIIYLFPRLTKSIPSPLVAIVTVSIAVISLGLDTKTVGDLASISGAFPQFHIPMVPFTLETLYIIFPYAVILAAIGLIESLLTLTVVAEMTESYGSSRKECLAQGTANTVTGLFGGMGGCAMIGQSMINVASGARHRLSGISAALFLLTFILFASGLIERIPIAALVGVMFVVVIGTFEWASFKIVKEVPKEDAFVLVLVTVVTVLTDLAIAVIVGVIISALVFAWKSARHIRAHTITEEKGQKTYLLEGPLFFGSASNFREIFTPKEDPKDVVVDFAKCRVLDHSGIEAIDTLAERYMRNNIQLHLRHLSTDCQKLLSKASRFVEPDDKEDPHYGLAVDYTKIRQK
ncbi:MAG: SulP family inorganic anion transporter [Alphaproteobacteria bacterium]|nr:SulP family inorganic anion transporter [Alphaproteobacteria bacterium]MDD9919289.1 SulP family inorganic anion transporter [Alphaproteobacteria bacterium]